MLRGTSSAIYIAGAVRLSRELGPGHTIVTILCDLGTRYQAKMYNVAWLKERGLPYPEWMDETEGSGSMNIPDVRIID